MSRTFIKGVLIAAATVTALSAAPARAGNDDLKRFVGAAATLYLLGRVIEQGGNGKVTIQNHSNNHKAGRPNWREHGYKGKAPIPRQCMVRVNRKHTTFAVSRGCMKRHHRAFHRLPDACRMAFRQGGKKRYGFAVRCLRRNGFELARY